MRAFTTTISHDLPRKMARRSTPVSPMEMPTFEHDAFAETDSTIMNWRPTTSTTSMTPKRSKKKQADEGLSIPSDLVSTADLPPPNSSPRRVPSRTRQESYSEPEPQRPMSELPWYLSMAHQQQDISPDHPMHQRQKLPDLPVDPPPILRPLLESLSVNIGLHYITILDLRALDPPPALGANLLMVLGTARSEKHLHVSADRFCRWLRSQYKFAPYADGLLGRNELKIKMRRKNRKAKLLANVGVASAPEDVDDGIRTGWVCVHVGQVDPVKGAAAGEQSEIEGFVGFGEEENRVTVVVQMFTEEKREDVDLEGLWKEKLERNLRKQAYRRAERDEVDGLEEAGIVTGEKKQTRKKLGFGPGVDLLDRSKTMPEQIAAMV